MPSGGQSNSRVDLLAAMGAALVVLTFVALSGTTSNSFLNYDDDVYVTDNPHVLGGLNVHSLAWALTSTEAANWHPVTWLSHMLDCQWFGLNAGAHHLVNLLFHTANVALLFLLVFPMMAYNYFEAKAAARRDATT